MKKLIYVPVFFLITWLVFSCDQNEVEPQTQVVVQNDTTATSGRLIVDVVDANLNPVNNAFVELFSTYEDYQNGIDLYRFQTNNRGEVDFGFILIGNYYIRASNLTFNNDPGDVVQVRSQRREEVLIIIN